jgi:hypothetical protein
MKRIVALVASAALLFVIVSAVMTVASPTADAKKTYEQYDCCTYYVSFACIPRGHQPRTLSGIWLDGRCVIGVMPSNNPNGCVVSGFPDCL